MRKTFNQVIKTFETFADNHKMIAQVTYEPYGTMADNYLYPLMWIVYPGGNISGGETRLNFTIRFHEFMKTDYSGRIKALSDTLKLCSDFYAIFNQNEDEYGFYIDDEVLFRPIDFEGDDKIAGHEMDIVVNIYNESAENEVPI